jgi:hypothetical protein
MDQKLVVHFTDGRLVKGHSRNFYPNKETFVVDDVESGESVEVQMDQLKAVFFVKTFEGQDGYESRPEIERAGFGKRIQVRFKDGETIVGYTSGYFAGRKVFFVFPADPEDNNDRILVVGEATDEVSFI